MTVELANVTAAWLTLSGTPPVMPCIAWANVPLVPAAVTEPDAPPPPNSDAMLDAVEPGNALGAEAGLGHGGGLAVEFVGRGHPKPGVTGQDPLRARTDLTTG